MAYNPSSSVWVMPAKAAISLRNISALLGAAMAVSNGGGRQSGPAVCGERTAFCTDRGILSEVWPPIKPPIKPAIKPAIKPSERRRAGSRGLRPFPGPHPGVKGGFEAIRRPLPALGPWGSAVRPGCWGQGLVRTGRHGQRGRKGGAEGRSLQRPADWLWSAAMAGVQDHSAKDPVTLRPGRSRLPGSI